ncbi:MAG: hypothetical protein QOG62_2702 [Thermoleophilaceae bacterium]|nr:hypothetical protein [Thermoleophilaceae bacterium]
MICLALAACLLAPPAALAQSGDGDETEFVTYDIQGIYKGNMRVHVTGGNTHARQELEGKTSRFDMTKAAIEVLDRNDDGYRDWRDLTVGKGVRVRAEFAKKRPKTMKRPVDAVWSLDGKPGGVCAGLPGISRLCPF